MRSSVTASIIFILAASFVFAQHGDGTLPFTIGPAWHWLQDIYSANGVGADSNNDGAIDTSNNLRVNNTVAKVFSVAGGDVMLQISAPAGSYASVDFMSGGASAWRLGRDSSGNFYIDQTGAGNAITIDASRNVGIGTSTPSAKLQVSGSVQATSFLYSSDALLKKEITPLRSSLEKISRLEGVSFTWKNTSERSIGFIAQDVEKVYPELVFTDSNSGLKSVEYANLAAPLIEAVKEQQKQIEALQADVQELKSTCR